MAPETYQRDDWQLFGWNPTPGIVSVWAGRDGRALVWQRQGDQVACTAEHFRPWLLATSLDDLEGLGPALAPEDSPQAARARLTYRELSGSSPCYRFLLAAASFETLERSLCAGASRRHGSQVRRLHELGNAVYRVGLVEQYLMASGQVYFRGLRYDALHRLQLDLETTALDPAEGRIFMAALRDSRGLATVLEAPTPADEPRLLADLVALIQQRDPDIIENHNLFGFDLPFLAARAALHRVPLALGRRPGPPLLQETVEPRGEGRSRVRYTLAGRELLDTLDAVRRHDFVVRDLPSYRLKDVARAYGFATPDRVYLDGAQIVSTYAHDPETVRRYALDDVAEVDALSRRLLVAPFALAQMAPRRYERLAVAGPAMGILEPMLIRAYLRAGAAPPCQSSATAEGPHSGGGLHLFVSGVAERVVKADVASLYPSLMRSERIGPACDEQEALLTLVDRLTALRLEHKAAARAAAPGSAPFAHHDALQAAMKLLINSAYGYMGAGSMALFADRAAADTVTRRGREVLAQVVGGLQQRGVALIEADTDGVYFAVPAGWSEAQERALVAAVGATLPPGIRLEYEGRYQAMFSHTVKNYALLLHDGSLVVRGAALRSRRAEPFAERWLHEALAALLRNDLAGLVAGYKAVVAALHERNIPTAEVAAQARLAKSPEDYARSRRSSREGPYEALLAAGRTSWSSGERVRVYRRAAGWALLSGDERDEGAGRHDPRDYDVAHYLRVLQHSYVERLRSAFDADDFEQLFRLDGQLGMFDRPLEQVAMRRLRCPELATPVG